MWNEQMMVINDNKLSSLDPSVMEIMLIEAQQFNCQLHSSIS